MFNLTTSPKERFENYKIAFAFFYPLEKMKSWIDIDSYDNLFERDWEECLMLTKKCFEYAEGIESKHWETTLNKGLRSFDIEVCFAYCVAFINHYNTLKD